MVTVIIWLVTMVTLATAVVKYSITTSRQSSGSPVIKEDMNKPRLVAIHNGSTAKQNYGVRLSEILNHMEGRPHLPSECCITLCIECALIRINECVHVNSK